MSLGTTNFKVIYSGTTYNLETATGCQMVETQVKPVDFLQTSAVTGKKTVYDVGEYYNAKITLLNIDYVEIDKWRALKNKVVDFYPRSGGSWHFNAIITSVIPFSIKNIFGIDAMLITVESQDYVTYPTLTPP